MTASHIPRRVRAVGLSSFGDPDVLGVVERTVPPVQSSEIQIRVRAAAVNPADLDFRAGVMADNLASFDPPYVPGMDAAGTVQAVGDNVEHVAPGDRVMAVVNPFLASGGAQSEEIVVRASSVVRIPDTLPLEAAATLPMNGLTAVEALDMLAVPEGGVLAVTGGTGWLATLAIVLAKSRGIRVVADAPTAEIEHVKALGADCVVKRGDGVAARILAAVPGGVDGMMDTAMIGPELFPAIRDGGGWAVMRFQQDETVRGIVRHPVLVAKRMTDTDTLQQLAEMAANGNLPTKVAGTYPPERASEAHRRQEAGGVRGRLLITFGD